MGDTFYDDYLLAAIPLFVALLWCGIIGLVYALRWLGRPK